MRPIDGDALYQEFEAMAWYDNADRDLAENVLLKIPTLTQPNEWVSVEERLPAAQEIEPCFQALGFAQRPTDAARVKEQYRRMAKALHPDTGGNEAAFTVLRENFEQCMRVLNEKADNTGTAG